MLNGLKDQYPVFEGDRELRKFKVCTEGAAFLVDAGKCFREGSDFDRAIRKPGQCVLPLSKPSASPLQVLPKPFSALRGGRVSCPHCLTHSERSRPQ